MNYAWLEELLPPAMLTKRTKILWLLFFFLFPIAYVGGIFLEIGEESPAMMAGYQDRASSIRTAQEFALSKGFPVYGWHQYAVAKTNDDLVAYYGDKRDPVLAEATAVAPEQEIEVLFRSPDQSHEFRTYLSLMGRVTGFDFGKSRSITNANISIGPGSVITTTTSKPDDDKLSMSNAIALSDMEAEAIARRALAGNAALSRLISLGTARVKTNDDDSARRDVKWDASPAGKPDLTLHITVGVRDGDVVAQRISATVVKGRREKSASFPKVFIGIYSSFLGFGIFYALVRYAKRTLQKEVSHLRTLVVAALFAISYTTLAYSAQLDLIAEQIGGETFAKIFVPALIAAITILSLMGLLVGIAYGSGEGELREAYPGKLTSLDALLAGRIVSRDVGSSVLFGAAAAGWLLLVHRAASEFFTTDVLATRSDVLTVTFARMPWLTLLLGRQYGSLLTAVTGLLLPASFLLRRNLHKVRRFAWLILFSVLSVLRDASRYPTLASACLAIVVLVCALLLPFFALDLLAAIVSLSVLSFVEELTRLNAVFPSWSHFAATLAAVAVVSLIVATYLSVRGNRVREEDVRPQYAKNLAQRMSLQAEVQAAREAQLRLLPQSTPDLPGMQCAACCLPARGVGGDFYDFYRLDSNRLAIFVAQGGDQGLASALCIALAKGVLMHASLQPHSPVEMVAYLEATLAELLEGGSEGRISFLYAVVDTRRNLVNYARLGDWPKFVGYRESKVITSAAQLERVVPVAGRARNAATIYEGSAHTSPGDYLIFFTKGVSFLKTKRFSRRDYQWLEVLMPLLLRPAEALQMSLADALAKQHRRASDDLTAVVLRVVQTEMLTQEVVA
jgi:serine phosphatase RsbU (regulator of sigma subunit)